MNAIGAAAPTAALRWAVVDVDHSVHVVPVTDYRPHAFDAAGECACQPDADHGGYRPMFVHREWQ